MIDTVSSQSTDISSCNTLYNNGEGMFKRRMDYNGERQARSRRVLKI